jgi:hypothetical protein
LHRDCPSCSRSWSVCAANGRLSLGSSADLREHRAVHHRRGLRGRRRHRARRPGAPQGRAGRSICSKWCFTRKWRSEAGRIRLRGGGSGDLRQAGTAPSTRVWPARAEPRAVGSRPVAPPGRISRRTGACGGVESALDGVPARAARPDARLYKFSKRAARVGFDFAHPATDRRQGRRGARRGARGRRQQPSGGESRGAVAGDLRGESATLLFAAANLARKLGCRRRERRCAPPTCKFERRFRAHGGRLAVQSRGEEFSETLGLDGAGERSGWTSNVPNEAPAGAAAGALAGAPAQAPAQDPNVPPLVFKHDPDSADCGASREEITKRRCAATRCSSSPAIPAPERARSCPSIAWSSGRGRRGPHRAHPAPAARRARAGGAHRRRALPAGRRHRGVPRALRRPSSPRPRASC